MLPLRNRLKRKKDFERVFKQGRGVFAEGLFLKAKSNNNRYSRFGFIVSGKVSKKAVVRNKIRRQLHEVVRGLLPNLKTEVDAVFIVRPGFKIRNFASLEKSARLLLAKSGVL